MLKTDQLIPIPLLLATALVGYMVIVGGGISGPSSNAGQIIQIADFPPLLLNAPSYSCPSWMDQETCTLLSSTCGNGVCDDVERCNTCAFDCGCGGAQVCNSQTGRCHSPAGVCQAPRGV